MIPVFLIASGTSMADYGAVVALDHAARARPAGSAGSTGSKGAVTAAFTGRCRSGTDASAQRRACPPGGQPPGPISIAPNAVEHLLETADLKWGAVGLIHRSGGARWSLGGGVDRHPQFHAVAHSAGGGHWGRAAQSSGWLAKREHASITFEEQLPDCLEFISRSMRAGHAFSVAPRNGAQGVQRASGGRIQTHLRGQNLGLPLQTVSTQDGAPHASLDMQFFVSAYSCKSARAAIWRNCSISSRRSSGNRFKLRARIRAT